MACAQQFVLNWAVGFSLPGPPEHRACRTMLVQADALCFHVWHGRYVYEEEWSTL